MSNTHEANVVTVGPILPHPNADKLELTHVGGYQIVIGKDQFKEGDLAVYVQPDSVVPQTEPFRFIWQDHVGIDGKVPERRRRITVKRLRKEYSEGLLMPLSAFETEFASKQAPDAFSFTDNISDFDAAALLGITHYVPEEDPESTKASRAATPRRKHPKTLKGWFWFILFKLGLKGASKSYAQEVSFDLPIYDVNALKNAKRSAFREGELVTVTEKIHGSNARYVFIPDDDKIDNPLNPTGKFYLGNHEQWKLDGPHVWGNAVRQFPQIEEWCHQHPGWVLYGEVGPTQKGFRYGAEAGETFFFAFDAYKDGVWEWPGNLGFTPCAPILFSGPYDAEGIKAALVDGPSVVPGAGNIREGIVISSKERRLKLKVVSNVYFEQENKR